MLAELKNGQIVFQSRGRVARGRHDEEGGLAHYDDPAAYGGTTSGQSIAVAIAQTMLYNRCRHDTRLRWWALASKPNRSMGAPPQLHGAVLDGVVNGAR